MNPAVSVPVLESKSQQSDRQNSGEAVAPRRVQLGLLAWKTFLNHDVIRFVSWLPPSPGFLNRVRDFLWGGVGGSAWAG